MITLEESMTAKILELDTNLAILKLEQVKLENDLKLLEEIKDNIDDSIDKPLPLSTDITYEEAYKL